MNYAFCDELLQYQDWTAEAKDPLYSSYILNCVFNAFSSSTAIMLNILTIHAMRKTPSLPKPLKTLLLSLAVSDLGVGLLVQPLYIALLVSEDNHTCAMYAGSFIIIWFFAIASFLGILAITVDRFLAIHFHLRYQEIVTYKRVVAVVISIWVFSAFLSLIDLWMAAITYGILVTIFSGLCFISTGVVYCRIYFTVRRHANQIQALQVQQVAQNGEMGNVTRQRKTAIGIFYVYLVFLVCYLPEYCTSFASILIREPSITLEGFELYTWTLVFVNSSLSPLVYCWKMRHIRHAIIDTLRNMFPSNN
ncbi:melanocortin receptor 5-like [Oculina patagonica]